jgi:hypothetical protein
VSVNGRPAKYLVVRNWNKYQHYKDRRPVWIKFYVELLDDYEMQRLPVSTRLLWDMLLLLAAKHNNAIPNDHEAISRVVGMEHEAVTNGIQHLLEGRWLSQTSRRPPASKTLADGYQDASPEKELEKEKEKAFTSRGKAKGIRPQVWLGQSENVQRLKELSDRIGKAV